MNVMGRYRIKYVVKQSLAYLLYYSGLLNLYKAIKLRNKVVVLMYHRVMPQEELACSFSHEGIIVERSVFDMQMDFLKRKFNVFSISEFCRHLEHRIPFGKHACLITFDDGWKDNFIHSLPVLKKLGLPAVIFLPVNYIGTVRMFWQEELMAAILRIYRITKDDRLQEKRLRDLLAKHRLDEILDVQEGSIREEISRIIQAKKAEPLETVHALIRYLSDAISGGVRGNSVDAFIDWSDVDIMAADGISFGSHGMNHRILTQIPLAEAQREMADSKRILEEKTSAAVPAISYPNGDCNHEIIDAAKAEGYRIAFTTKNGYADMSGEPLAINRINIHTSAADNIPLFLSRILGIF